LNGTAMADLRQAERISSLDVQIAALRSLIDETEVTAAGFRKWVMRGNFPALRAALATLERIAAGKAAASCDG